MTRGAEGRQTSLGEVLGVTDRGQALLQQGMDFATRQVRKGIDVEEGVLTFRQFVDKVNPRYRWVAHTIILAERLQEVADGKRNRLIINLPPRHGKTEIVSRLFSAYWLYRFPDEWVGLATYGSDLSEMVSGNAQQNYVLGGGELGKLTANRHWETTGGGGMWAAGMGGPITGKEFNLGIIDDPIKNAEEAGSELTGIRNQEWYASTFYTRESYRHSAIIVMNTRWPGPGDMVGWLLSEEGTEDDDPEKWHIIVMPAIYEGPYEYPTTCTVEPDWRLEGEALWPERYNEARLNKIKRRVQPYWWASLYQQLPHDRAGDKFKKEWFKIIPPSLIPSRVVKDIRYWDIASGKSKRNDWTVGLRMRRANFNEYIIMDVVRIRLEADARDQVIRRTAERDGRTVTHWFQKDPAQAGKDFGRHIRILLSGYDVRFDPISMDKELHGDPASSAAEAGYFYLVQGGWNKAFLDEIVTLWNGQYDDQGDTLAGAYNKLALNRRSNFNGINQSYSVIDLVV